MTGKKIRPARLSYMLGATVLFTYMLMVMGTVVTSTGSGLACPDWPLCYGSVKPPLELSIWFEWGHRLLGGITGLLIIASTITVWRSHRGMARFFTLAMLSLLGVAVVLGGITVLMEAPVLTSFAHVAVISSHLLIATMVLTCLIFTLGYVLGSKGAADSRGYFRLIFGAVYFQVVLGILVRYSGATLACPDLPLCGGVSNVFSSYLTALHFVHRVSALMIFILSAAVLFAALRNRIGARRFAVVFGLVIAQAAFGALIVATQMFLPMIILHAATGFALLGFLAYHSVPEFFGVPGERGVETS